MIDKYIIKFLGAIDTFTEWLFTPRCKCKKKK